MALSTPGSHKHTAAMVCITKGAMADVVNRCQRVLELKLLILNLFSHIILKGAYFSLSNILHRI